MTAYIGFSLTQHWACKVEIQRLHRWSFTVEREYVRLFLYSCDYFHTSTSFSLNHMKVIPVKTFWCLFFQWISPVTWFFLQIVMNFSHRNQVLSQFLMQTQPFLFRNFAWNTRSNTRHVGLTSWLVWMYIMTLHLQAVSFCWPTLNQWCFFTYGVRPFILFSGAFWINDVHCMYEKSDHSSAAAVDLQLWAIICIDLHF